MSMIAFKVAVFAAALGLFLYAMVRWRTYSLNTDERLAISFGDPGYLARCHMPMVVMMVVVMLCGFVALAAIVIAAGAFLIGA